MGIKMKKFTGNEETSFFYHIATFNKVWIS